MNVIDVWNARTFDVELLAKLTDHATAIEGFLASKIDAQDIDELIDVFTEVMSSRTIRGWHYTRLIDEEVEIIRRNGIYPSSLESIRARLGRLVEAGIISPAEADRLFADSPYHEQNDIRANRFWMTSNPITVDSSGVTLLLGNWGGEGVYFWQQNSDLKKRVAEIGRPRVLELAVPVRTTGFHATRIASGVMRTFGETAVPNRSRADFDFYTKEVLAADAVRAIHTEGEPQFSLIGNGYPGEYSSERD